MSTDPLKVKKGDKVRYAKEARAESSYQKGDILTITDVNHPFYWAKHPNSTPSLFFRSELEVADAPSPK